MNEEHVLVIGTPGSGKSVGAARDALASRGSVVIQDPHSDSLANLVLTHAEGRPVLFDRLSDLRHPLGYGLLKPSTHPDPRTRRRENLRRAELFTDVMVLRGGSPMASTPLREEWTLTLLLALFNQDPPKPPEIVPSGLVPGSDGFRALKNGCTEDDLRHKLGTLEGLSPRALRAELGSTSRAINAVFREEEFIARCRYGFDLGQFLQSPGAMLLVEGGDAPPEVKRSVMCGINLLVTEHAERRPEPYPLIEMVLDECTNAGTAGDFEQRKAGETRKRGLNWKFMCQWPNFPGGDDGFFQNCGRKEVYRIADYALSRRLAAIIAAGLPPSEESRASRIDALTTDLMTLPTGTRYVTDRSGSRRERVRMLENPYPDWPGLRESKLREKIQWLYANRPEYRTPGTPPPGGGGTGGSTPPSPFSPPPTPSSPPGSSPAQRLRAARGNAAGGS